MALGFIGELLVKIMGIIDGLSLGVTEWPYLGSFDGSSNGSKYGLNIGRYWGGYI